MKKILIAISFLAFSGTSMAAEPQKDTSLSSANKDNLEQSFTVNTENPRTDNKILDNYVNLEYRYIEVNMPKPSNSIENKIELFSKDGNDVLGMEFEEPNEITKFISRYGEIERDDSFVNEILLNDGQPTITVYKNNKTKEFTYSNIYLYELKDKRIMATVKFQFDKPLESNASNTDHDGVSTRSMTQRFSLTKNNKYKLVTYGSSFGKSYFIYVKVADTQ